MVFLHSFLLFSSSSQRSSDRAAEPDVEANEVTLDMEEERGHAALLTPKVRPKAYLRCDRITRANSGWHFLLLLLLFCHYIFLHRHDLAFSVMGVFYDCSSVCSLLLSWWAHCRSLASCGWYATAVCSEGGEAIRHCCGSSTWTERYHHLPCSRILPLAFGPLFSSCVASVPGDLSL